MALSRVLITVVCMNTIQAAHVEQSLKTARILQLKCAGKLGKFLPIYSAAFAFESSNCRYLVTVVLTLSHIKLFTHMNLISFALF